MWKTKKIACVIPARLQSSRFPRKILAPLKGKPLIQWVWESAKSVSFFDEVVFAIDSDETAKVIESFQGKYFFTSLDCASGTDRLVELQRKKLLGADVWVNWQADEPFVDQEMIASLLQSCDRDNADVWTLKKRIEQAEEIAAPDVCKVVCDKDGFALYFSRSTIPYYRKQDAPSKVHYKHIGLYAYSSRALEKIGFLSPCELENAEHLEQLRFLYNGLKIRVHETEKETLGIDLPEHLAKAERICQS